MYCFTTIVPTIRPTSRNAVRTNAAPARAPPSAAKRWDVGTIVENQNGVRPLAVREKGGVRVPPEHAPHPELLVELTALQRLVLVIQQRHHDDVAELITVEGRVTQDAFLNKPK